ncbi:MAG TPA: Gx transporter family protein [bacterium]|nr:Gx transporter family protein [bacterium]
MNRPAARTTQSVSRPSMMQVSMLTALAVAFRAAELFIPTPLPWLRLGLANVVILIVLVSFGVRAALLVNVARILLASFVIGTFLSPGFWLSLCAGVVSCLSMAVVWYCFGGWLSYVGTSVVGAYFHTMSQFFVAYLIFVRHVAILKLMPYFLLFSLGTGALTGVAATAILVWARRHGVLTPRAFDHRSANRC